MPTIQNFLQKIKSAIRALNRREDVFIVILIVLVGLGSFGLGRLSVTKKGEVHVFIPEPQELYAGAFSGTLEEGRGGYVGSIHGSKYHAPWCSGAVRIKKENEIWFASQEEAQQAGYTPAANCKGL